MSHLIYLKFVCILKGCFSMSVTRVLSESIRAGDQISTINVDYLNEKTVWPEVANMLRILRSWLGLCHNVGTSSIIRWKYAYSFIYKLLIYYLLRSVLSVVSFIPYLLPFLLWCFDFCSVCVFVHYGFGFLIINCISGLVIREVPVTSQTFVMLHEKLLLTCWPGFHCLCCF